MAEVRELFALNPNHEGIKFGIAWFEKWMSDSMEDKDVPAAIPMRYVAEHGADPEHMFVCMAAMWTRYNRENNPFCNLKNLILSVGYRCCRWCGWKGNTVPKRKDRWAAGNYVRDELGPLLVRISYAVDKLWANKEEVKKKAALSWNTDPETMQTPEDDEGETNE